LHVENSLVVGATGGTTAYAFNANAGSNCRVTHCRLYANTGWYNGDGTIAVYANVDGISELDFWCAVPEGDGFLSSFASGNVIDHVEDIYIPRIGTAFDTPVTTMFKQDTGFAGYPGCTCRRGDYLYTSLYTGTDDWKLRETKISDGTNNDVTVHSDGPAVFLIQFCVPGDRIAYVMVGGSSANNNNLQIYLVDFSIGTSSLVYETPDQVGNLSVEDADIYSGPLGVVSVTNSSGELIVAFYGELTNYDFGQSDYRKGIYFLVKNHTQDSGWNMLAERISDTIYFPGTLYIYTGAKVVGNRYVVIVPSMSTLDSTVNGANNLVGMHVLDIDEMTHQVETLLVPWGNSGVMDFYRGCTDNATAKAYAVVQSSNSAEWIVYAFDPANMSIAEHDRYPTSGFPDIYFFSSRTHGYIYKWQGATQGDLVRISDDTELWSNFAHPSEGFFSGLDNACTAIDDNGRLWMYDPADSTIKGRLVSNSSNAISFAAGVSYPGTAPQRMTLVHLGDIFVLGQHKFASNDTRFYYVKE
jgi:hypothetical protein